LKKGKFDRPFYLMSIVKGEARPGKSLPWKSKLMMSTQQYLGILGSEDEESL